MKSATQQTIIVVMQLETKNAVHNWAVISNLGTKKVDGKEGLEGQLTDSNDSCPFFG